VQELDFHRLIQTLRNPPEVSRPVIMPDFFVDHFVISGSLDSFIESLQRLAQQGGGNLLGTQQFIRRGGNAANLAAALHTLGMNPYLIATTDAYGSAFLSNLMPEGFDLAHIQTDGRLSSTVSLELEHEDRHVNLMISDSGSSADFTFSKLKESDLDAIQGSSLVALLNLNHNKNPLQLAQDLFQFTKESSRALTFMDFGDPSGNPDIIEPLTKALLVGGLVDIVSMNENEAAWFAWALSGRDSSWREKISDPAKWLEAATFVSNEIGIRIDLHTPLFTATLLEDECTTQPVFETTLSVACGAGDAWNAGNICGTLYELNSSERLILSNAIAALYVSSSTASHPSVPELIGYFQTSPKAKDVDEKLLSSK